MFLNYLVQKLILGKKFNLDIPWLVGGPSVKKMLTNSVSLDTPETDEWFGNLVGWSVAGVHEGPFHSALWPRFLHMPQLVISAISKTFHSVAARPYLNQNESQSISCLSISVMRFEFDSSEFL
jgi:hypothetical protein